MHRPTPGSPTPTSGGVFDPTYKIRGYAAPLISPPTKEETERTVTILGPPVPEMGVWQRLKYLRLK